MALSKSINQNVLNLRLQRTDFTMILDECRKKKKFIDVQLQIGDQLFDAHRVILAAYSPVLEAAISDQWSTSKICPISGEYVDPSIVEELLHFLYTGSIDLTLDNVHPVCVAAHFLQIATLLEPAVQHLCQLISVDNVLTLFEFSFTCQLEQLRDSCLQFIPRNNSEVFKDSNILKLSTKSFKDLITGLREQLWDPRTQLRVSTFDCIVRWTEMNLSERLDEFPGLLKSIPLEELPHDFLTGTVSTHPLVKSSTSGLEAVSAVIENYQTLLKSARSTIKNMIVVNTDRDTKFDRLSCYDSLKESWSKLPDMLEPKQDCNCTIINGRDIVVSGELAPNSYKYINSIEMFAWTTQTWTKLPSLPKGFDSRIHYSIVTLNNQLYAVGDEYNSDEPSTLHCYSFEAQQWKPLTSLKTSRYKSQLVEYGNHLYAFCGGADIVEKYDPVSDQWSVLEGISVEAYGFTEHRGKIYAVRQSKDLMEFDPETGNWTTIATWEKCCPCGKLVSINGRLLSFDIDDDISEFDSATRKWRKFLKLDTKMDLSLLIAGEFY